MISGLYEIFKHWCEKGSIYIISDTHFEDSDCKIMNKEWIEPQDHINLLKSYVHKNDTLVCLGDVGNPVWFSQLKCRKILIKGNHDLGTQNYKEYFDEIYEGPVFISKKILLSHEPIEGLDYVLNIHGHNHAGKMRKDIYHLNVASDVVDYKPISLGDIIKNGYLAEIKNIHRKTIDKARQNSQNK